MSAPTFDNATPSGTLNSQAELWTRRPARIRTTAVTGVTYDTIAIAASTGVVVEVFGIGRTSAGAALGEHTAFEVYNNSGTLTLRPRLFLQTTNGNPFIWSTTLTSGTSYFSGVISGTNLNLTLTPLITTQTDWQILSTVRVV